MNYIKQLQADLKANQELAVYLEEGLRSLRDYATSDKYQGEGIVTMNPRDIQLRVEEILSFAPWA